MHFFDNSSLIFPITQPLPRVLGDPRIKEDVLDQIRSDPGTNAAFQALPQQAQNAFLDFCMGNRGLKVTYDPFFLHIFDSVTHPGRLDRLLSCILGQDTVVKEILPRERRRISEDGSLIIMDILVQLSDGSMANVEMQRIGYDFPIQRSFCYGVFHLIFFARWYIMNLQSWKPGCIF
ncbi:MAG: Rpn family recombination-promoting nuclease/putative transposase [Acetatifactor sp.]|nr:Rpn family recombination-promoting nuclease/putative transposase [Acetatifactor sp.]